MSRSKREIPNGYLSETIPMTRALDWLRSSEMSDPTITVTVAHLGEQSVQSVFGLIYPPQVALMSLGSIDVRPWVEGGQVHAQPLLRATLADAAGPTSTPPADAT